MNLAILLLALAGYILDCERRGVPYIPKPLEDWWNDLPDGPAGRAEDAGAAAQHERIEASGGGDHVRGEAEEAVKEADSADRRADPVGVR